MNRSIYSSQIFISLPTNIRLRIKNNRKNMAAHLLTTTYAIAEWFQCRNPPPPLCGQLAKLPTAGNWIKVRATVSNKRVVLAVGLFWTAPESNDTALGWNWEGPHEMPVTSKLCKEADDINRGTIIKLMNAGDQFTFHCPTLITSWGFRNMHPDWELLCEELSICAVVNSTISVFVPKRVAEEKKKVTDNKEKRKNKKSHLFRELTKEK